ncbi:SRPBCC family protein [Marilutibacter maris]|uniref:SRPBCC domain-containing protein n=1 Tax=Marilutibacter maris TaxID=1605891 RepID=A0A2U9T4N4_9GAMM|nr:SRPBCC family protein [Lysobacter maris]AWV07463.1 hypothetical protein C9I47_1774 [Lysobacter maris]
MKLRIRVATLLLLCLGGTATAEVKDSAADGFTLENSVEVAVDADTAWRALVGEVDRWWPKGHTWWGAQSRLRIEPRAGGCFCEIAGDRQARHMQVVFVEPGKLLRMTGGLGPLQGMGVDGVLEFRLAEAGEGATRITLFYRAGGYAPDDLAGFAPVVDKVQAMQLGGLADHLRAEGGAAGGGDR